MAAEPRRTGDHALPRRIGRYEAFLQIGAGGMARVYLAVQRGVAGQKAELVVLKMLRPEVVEDEHVLSLFTDEARIAMRLEHPNVVRTREVIADPPDYLLVMDFQNGQSLLNVVSRLGREAVPLDEHIYMLGKVLGGLSYAHELEDENGRPFGIVHRDVSPANVLVTYSGEVKLLDFGIAKATGALAATRDGVVKGKLGYAAPEQCLGKPADPRSDVYAVGVMLWEAIAGRRRVSGETWQSVLQARLDDTEPDLEEVCPDAPEALTKIVGKALARDPNDRYATAREFQSHLEKYLRDKRATIGASRIAAMLKPHFEKDRAELHRTVEAFLKSLKANQDGQLRRIPLPGGAPASAKSASPKPEAARDASEKAAPFVQEENTAPIPVDAALLMLSRGESATAQPVESSRPTSPPPAPNAVPSAASTPQQPSAVTTPLANAVTTPLAIGGAAPTPAPPDLDNTAHADTPMSSVATPSLPRPPTSSPIATDAYGLVTVSKPVPSPASRLDAALPMKRPRAWPFLLVAAGALGLGAIALSLRSGSKGPAVATSPSAVTERASADAPKAAAEVETVNVRISVDPADAVVKLDGNVLSGNPFAGPLPKDNAVHELTVFAEGCRDVKQNLHLSRDVALLVALKCQNNAIRAKARATAPRSPAAAHAPLSPPPPSMPAAEAAPQAPPPEPAKETPPAPAEPPPKSGASGGYHIRSEI